MLGPMKIKFETEPLPAQMFVPRVATGFLEHLYLMN